jgi:hypothetical protein
MPYLTRAERRYRQKQAKAGGPIPGTAGGWGKDSEVDRGDLLLIRKAIRQRWSTPAATRQAIVARLSQLLSEAKTAGNVRLQLSIFATYIDMQADNHRRLFELLDEQLPL